jgi:LPS-assembly lipoprotein
LSFDIASKHVRGAAITLVLAFAAFLSACQIQPLYSETSAVAGKLTSVGFSEATSRVEQEVRNHLIFLATRGAGEPVKPAYEVELQVRRDVTDALLVESSDRSRAGRVTVSVDYTLRATTDGKVIKSGNRYATALVDFPRQEFAKVRAIRDGEDRAARQAAEFVGLDIVGALGR